MLFLYYFCRKTQDLPDNQGVREIDDRILLNGILYQLYRDSIYFLTNGFNCANILWR